MSRRGRRKPTPPYKSLFEEEVGEWLGKDGVYENDIINYTVPETVHKYIPDWTLTKKVYLEAKGVLDSDTRKKMLWVKECNPDYLIILVFMNATNKIAKNSKTSYGDWATKHGFPWFCWKTNPPSKRKIKELIKHVHQNDS